MIYQFCTYLALPITIFFNIVQSLSGILGGFWFKSDPENLKTSLGLKITVLVVSWLCIIGYLVVYVSFIVYKVRQERKDAVEAAKEKLQDATNRIDEVEFRNEIRKTQKSQNDGFRVKLDDSQFKAVKEFSQDIISTFQKKENDQDQAILTSLNDLKIAIDANTKALRENMAEKTCQCENDPDIYLSSLALLFE